MTCDQPKLLGNIAGNIAGYIAGYITGYIIGYNTGYITGYNTGYITCYITGYVTGYIAGYIESDAFSHLSDNARECEIMRFLEILDKSHHRSRKYMMITPIILFYSQSADTHLCQGVVQ